MVYLVTYDLNKSDKRYQDLYKILEQYDYIRDNGLDSVWFISTQDTSYQISQKVLTALDNNDRLFITKVNKDQYGGWLEQKIWDWIKSRL